MSNYANLYRQRGAFSIFAAFGMVVLIGCAGLAIDTGRMLVVRSELQTAMDACALAGALELNGLSDAAHRASSAARFVGGTRNNADFQSGPVTILDDDVTFPVTLNDSVPPTATTANGNTSRIVRCKVTSPGMVPLLLSVLGVDAISMTVSATATVQSAQSVCAIPMAIFGNSSAGANYGYTVGTSRITLKDDRQPGWFQWANVASNPSLSGLSDYANAFIKYGSCDVPTEVGRCIPIQTGAVASLSEYWNARFGVYKSLNPAEAIPDFTGYGFGDSTASVLDLYRTVHAPQRTSAQLSAIPPSYSVPANVNALFGASGRRLTVMPVVDADEESCDGDGQARRLIGWACVLMISPIRSNETGQVEYVGPANAPDTPCRTAGIPGSFNGSGPLVPALIK